MLRHPAGRINRGPPPGRALRGLELRQGTACWPGDPAPEFAASGHCSARQKFSGPLACPMQTGGGSLLAATRGTRSSEPANNWFHAPTGLPVGAPIWGTFALGWAPHPSGARLRPLTGCNVLVLSCAAPVLRDSLWFVPTGCRSRRCWNGPRADLHQA